MSMRRLFSLRGLTLSSIMLLTLIATGCVQNREPAFHRDAASEAKSALSDVVSEDIVGQVIEVISVVGDGDAVLIEADGPVKYTAYSLPDPARLVIDIPGVTLDSIESPIVVDSNFIDEITAFTSGDGDDRIGTIEIALKEGITHALQSGEDSILVNLRRDIFVPGVIVEEEDVVEVEDFDEAFLDEDEEDLDFAELFDDEVADDEVAGDEAAGDEDFLVDEDAGDEDTAYYGEDEYSPQSPASNIVNIDSRVDSERTVVRISGDGEIGNYHSFGLDDPTRLVVDIWGLGSTLESRTVSVDSEFIDRVRVGAHPDKVRLVFDSSLSELPEHSFSKSRGDLLVVFGETSYEEEVSEEASYVEEDEEEYSPPVAEDDEEYYTPPVFEEADSFDSKSYGEDSAAITIKDILFKKVRGQARLMIKTSGKADYDLTESMDGMSITLDIMDATIPEELKMTLDASDLKTPVLTISSFQAMTGDESMVRVIIKLKREVAYSSDVTRDKVYIDFSLAKDSAKFKKKADDVMIDDKMVEAVGDLNNMDSGYIGQRIDIDMVDADVRDILKLLAEVSDKNIITTSDVSGKVSLRLKDVPWDQVFDIILLMNGLDMIEEGNVIRVAPTAKVAAQRKQKHDADMAKRKLEPLVTEYIRISYDTATTMKGQIEGLLTDDVRATVTVHEVTNTLIVKATRSSIKEVLSYIGKLDIPTPQVLIEARIVEATSSFTRSLGIQWGLDTTVGNPTDKVQTVTFGSAPNFDIFDVPTVPGSTSTLTAGTQNWAVNLPAEDSLGAIGFVLGKSGANPLLLDLRISAGESRGLAKTISRPRIVTMDNKEAKIEQGESIPVAGSDGETKFLDANLSLTVTPHITPDGSVMMKIKASSNKPGEQANATGERGIDKQEANTEVLVKDGETTVIGGIVVSKTESQISGIPFLMDIPVLGWLFKSKTVKDNQRELLIFITPTILKNHTSDEY
ncbi:MAG: type IV pilus secretin PilQ [Deltaproteobacteria bacterium]|nr:type IV pilus secretin PilQ [Deltaproteobacteria bacterium]